MRKMTMRVMMRRRMKRGTRPITMRPEVRAQ